MLSNVVIAKTRLSPHGELIASSNRTSILFDVFINNSNDA